jgi:hypothetical protein
MPIHFGDELFHGVGGRSEAAFQIPAGPVGGAGLVDMLVSEHRIVSRGVHELPETWHVYLVAGWHIAGAVSAMNNSRCTDREEALGRRGSSICRRRRDLRSAAAINLIRIEHLERSSDEPALLIFAIAAVR